MTRVIDKCVVCGRPVDEDERVLLVRGKVRDAHCSESCLRDNLHRRRRASARVRRRWFLGSLLIAILLGGGSTLWQRHRAPQPEWIASVAPEPEIVPEAAPAVGPTYYGPAWPPTDAEWIGLLEKAHGIFPLPGPIRRVGRIDNRIFGPEPLLPPVCRKTSHCGVDLGGELWGEHVFAAFDGVVDRAQGGTGNEEHGGQYVRLSHFGGMVFTQYFHLAAIPKRLGRGDRVKAGELIGLVGDTGLYSKGSRRHLHFTLSILPSSAFPEAYWDPTPWMEKWPLRVPAHGTVAGLVPTPREGEPPRRRRSR